MPDEETHPEFDITEHEDRFRHEVERWVINKEIVGLKLASDSVELHLSSGSFIRFVVRGPDILIYLPEAVPDGEKLPDQVM